MTIVKPAALALLALTALQPATARTLVVPPAEQTVVESAAMLARLRGNSGISLQWISWDYRGHVRVSDRDGLVRLSGEQEERTGPGRLTLDGDVLAIDADSFTFRGHISIIGAPDEGRVCERDGTFEFLITQNRRYWRLQDMQACDGLTDYVDIYF
ncbi:hypothetical protein [Parasphingopyxis marina]|uniref:Uncharacterized protein n=1 Tax=Parasphingopyxis marina TaxID=2761622 RepID=A0A842HX46_9SPHN|nr:hypothetical protein [Parasphingopyxis marina]MBC2776084.1 hypothetical protein [Parasphingopyxis marina]